MLLLAAGLLAGPSLAADPEPVLEGGVTVEIRGLGAAPLGIASAFLTSSSPGVNLGRLQRWGPRAAAEPFSLPGSETYRGDLRFTLERRGRRRWLARSLALRYELRDHTSFGGEGVTLTDSLSAGGEAR